MIPTGHTNFWILQLTGWGLVLIPNLIVQYYSGFPTDILLLNTIVPFIVGLGVTSTYRYIIYQKNWKHWDLWKIIGLVAGSTILLTIIFILIIFIIAFLLFRALNVLEIIGNSYIFSIVMLAWTMIYFSIHYLNNWNQAEIEKWKLVAEMKEAQLGSLKAQINPHFVFNALNNIRSLILEDKEKAREMLLNFSDLFRYTLQNTDQPQITLEQELKMVNQYFELLSIQYEDKLKYKITIEENLEAIKIPPMMLQLLVENAIKHGISQFKEGGSILISIDKNKNYIHIKVKNTGSLTTSSALGEKLGVGLENIRKRLDLLYNGNAKLQLKEVNEFVEASINIPLA